VEFLVDIQLRTATMADIPALETLIRASVTALSSEHYTAEQIASALTHVFGVDTQLIADGTYFVAETDKQLVGSGGWSKRTTLFGGDQTKTDRIDALLDAATEAARIRAFYVHPDWSRRGIASRILATCENAARMAGFTRIELVATLPGVPLYTAHGYEKGEQMRLETIDGESLPAFRMTKSL
jgi:GNAT superfamily N-acetyltransferase